MASPTGRPAPWGAIFDWDGVVIDSSAFHEASWELLAKRNRRPLPPGHFKAGFGRKNEFIIPEILGWTRDPAEIEHLSLEKEALYRELIAEKGIEPLPGVRTWLERLAAAGVPCAVGSSTHRLNLDLTLRLTGLAEFFSAIISAEDVSRGKPDPEVFLKAAARLERAPGRCVVFEDAFVGIEAAHAGGMRAVAVATTHPLSALGAADLAVTRLDHLEPEILWERLGARSKAAAASHQAS